MLTEQEKDYQEWFKKAEEDLISNQAVLKEGSPSTACFLSQQIAEKYLKGLLIYFNKDFPKIHDLIELETRLADVNVGLEINSIHKDLKFLNRYYIETRYPGEYPEFTLQEAQMAFEAAKRIKEFVLKKVK